jgi:hypothetical protein
VASWFSRRDTPNAEVAVGRRGGRAGVPVTNRTLRPPCDSAGHPSEPTPTVPAADPSQDPTLLPQDGVSTRQLGCSGTDAYDER